MFLLFGSDRLRLLFLINARNPHLPPLCTYLEPPIRQGHRLVLRRCLVGLGVLLDQAALDGLDAGDENGGLEDVADGEGEDEEV
jgi:hypothetical protein